MRLSKVKAVVWERAAFQCEYCRLSQSSSTRMVFHIEHVIAKKHGGLSSLSNLALSCDHCNLHKGSDLTGIDPVTRKLTRLFNPRKDNWKTHFAIIGCRVRSATPIGRATIKVLKMNTQLRIDLRRASL